MDYVSIAQVRWNTNLYLTQTQEFLTIVELKKKTLLIEKIESAHSFYESIIFKTFGFLNEMLSLKTNKHKD